MFLVLRWIFQSALLALVTRVLGRFFPVLLRLLRVMRR
jgi:hypothetical protein